MAVVEIEAYYTYIILKPQADYTAKMLLSSFVIRESLNIPGLYTDWIISPSLYSQNVFFISQH